MNRSHHRILGTAGHIDHGKTALIKVLTGFDCDTHPEEKQRGITINLGFTHFTLPSGTTVSIVDVPGHRDFIHTMIAGASGIDFVMLVIAADSGIMPQTREHLQIMSMLGISQGIIALTKTDLVDEAILALAIEEIAEFTRGTFLEQAPVMPVSSLTKEGIDGLIGAIDTCSAGAGRRARGEVFRMFIDRIFTVSGFGTVVNGSVLGGALQAGTSVYLLPGGKRLRVRRLEMHGAEVASVAAGDRASINLAGMERDDFVRGMIVSDRPLHATTLIDTELSLFPQARGISLWSDAIFLLGTFEAQARIHLLDRNTLRGGETALAQIHLPRPCTICAGDRFIVRSTSSDSTIGGGEVLDAGPLHHRRRPPSLISGLEKIAEGKLPELIASEIRKAHGLVLHTDIADRLNASVLEVKEVMSGGLPGDMLAITDGERVWGIPNKEYLRFQNVIVRTIAIFHQRNPLVEQGRPVSDLLGVLGLDTEGKYDVFIHRMLEELCRAGKLKQVGSTWALSEHAVVLSAEMKSAIALVEAFFRGFGLKVPLASEIGEFTEKKRIDAATMNQVLRYLTATKRLYRVENDYIHADIVESVRPRLVEALSASTGGMTVAQFRDLISGNRKMCLLLFALFDAERITERKGDVRVLSAMGRAMISGKNRQDSTSVKT